MSDYIKYRGKCKELCDKLIEEFPHLKIVRGYYYDPIWNRKEPHWWCLNEKGGIVDPTYKQFAAGGIKENYEEFNGLVCCENCGKETKEEEIIECGRYPVCSTSCGMHLVGLKTFNLEK